MVEKYAAKLIKKTVQNNDYIKMMLNFNQINSCAGTQIF